MTMRIKGWRKQEEPKEDRNPKKLGWEGKKVVSRSPRLLCLPPVHSPTGRCPLTVHLARPTLRLGSRVRSYSPAWLLQEGPGFSLGRPDRPNSKPSRGYLQDLSLGSVLGGDTPVFPVSNPEPGSEQGLTKYLK